MSFDSSDARYTKTGAMSSGVGRVSGSSSGYAAARMSVRVPPGLTLFTRIPWGRSSSARTCVKPSRPNFETA